MKKILNKIIGFFERLSTVYCIKRINGYTWRKAFHQVNEIENAYDAGAVKIAQKENLPLDEARTQLIATIDAMDDFTEVLAKKRGITYREARHELIEGLKQNHIEIADAVEEFAAALDKK